MDRSEILAALTGPDGTRAIELPFLPGQPLAVKLDAEDQCQAMADAVGDLADIEPGFRSALEQRIYDFYLTEIQHGSADFATAQDQIDWENRGAGVFAGVRAATSAADVWPLVRFHRIVLHGAPDG